MRHILSHSNGIECNMEFAIGTFAAGISNIPNKLRMRYDTRPRTSEVSHTQLLGTIVFTISYNYAIILENDH